MSDKLDRVIAAIDAANAKDPNTVSVDGLTTTKELLYSQRMSTQLQQFCPDASEPLIIAAHGQHIERWKIPRDSYPKTRPGYLQWRRELGKFHAERTAEIMATAGYEQEVIEATKTLLTKQALRTNPDAQTLEDVICLVFVQYYLVDFSKDYDPEKLISIVQKTWNKMSEKGHQAALKLPLNEPTKAIVSRALS